MIEGSVTGVRFALYLIESLLLGGVCWLAFVGMGRLFAAASASRPRTWRSLLALVAGVFVVDAIGSEWIGQEFILPYQFAAIASLLGLGAWMTHGLRRWRSRG